MNKQQFTRNGHFNDLISSTFLFVVTYLLVFYISVFSTSFIAFTSGLNVPIGIKGINFDLASSSQDSLWNSIDNVFVIFSFSPLVLFLLLLICVIFMPKWHNNTISAFLFWMVFNCIMRLFGDFTFGLIFNLWQSNLLSDFLGLTNTIYGKLLFIAIGFIFMFLSPLFLRRFINYFFDPILTDNLQRDISRYFMFPILIGVVVLVLWFLPSFSFNETGIVLASVISIYIFSRGIVRQFDTINLSAECQENEGFNIKLSIKWSCLIVLLFIAAKIFLNLGFSMYSKEMSKNSLSNIFLTVIIIILAIVISGFIIYIIRESKYKKQNIIKEVEEADESINKEIMPEDFLKGTKWENQSTQRLKAQTDKLSQTSEEVDTNNI